MESLNISIKPKVKPSEGQCLRSSGYQIKVGDWELGRGVTDFRLEMPPGEKPKAIITFTPDIIDVDEMVATLGVQTLLSELNE